MYNPVQALIRSSAFWGKEIIEILRQPRLLFTLILGPFLILLIFGLGYQNKPPTFRTLFVAPGDSAISQNIQEFVAALGPQFIFEGVTSDQAGALERLHQGQVDLVAVAPDRVYETVQSNQQALFTLYTNEIDPYRAGWSQYYAYVYVNEVNKRVLESVVEKGQADTSGLREDLASARSNATRLREALERGDQATASASQQELSGSVDELAAIVGTGFAVLSGAQQAAGGGSSSQQASEILESLTNVQQSTEELDRTQPQNIQARTEQARRIEQELATLESNLDQFQSIEPGIIISPFGNRTQSILPIEVSPVHFFAPAVLALLLQHLAVTMAALSIVRERSAGAMEIFRVSPLSAAEALIGKYLSYLVFAGLVALILILLMVFVLGVPMLGNWWNATLVIGVLLFASLSIGFVISLVSQSDSQAVQYTMLVLIASVFFSGFMLSLDALLLPARAVSGALPTTYGILLLRNIMLRGGLPDLLPVVGLAVLGIVLYAIAWRMLRRSMMRSEA